MYLNLILRRYRLRPKSVGGVAAGAGKLRRFGYRVGNHLRYGRGAMTITPAFRSKDTPLIHDHALCGWRVASALPLPDLLPWMGEDRATDITVELGRVPDRLEDATVDMPLLQVGGDGACRFAAPGVATYLIDSGGRRVVIDPVLELGAPDIRVFLLGTVFGILCYRRGLLPLHASCVRIGDGAVALAGPSGMGKSTLAAALLRRGHAVLADDVTVIDAAAPGGPRVLPAFPRLKLWRDAMTRLDFQTEGLERSRPALDKFHLPVADGFCAQPLPLAAVFHLENGQTAERALPQRLTGPDAVARVGRNLYRNGLMMRLGLSDRVLPAIVTAAAVSGGTWSVAHGHDDGGLDYSVSGILNRMGA